MSCVIRVLTAAVIVLLAAVGCSQSPEVQPVPEVIEPRAQILPSGMGAAYFSIHNPSAEGDRLVSVESAAFSTVETHESVDEDGVMRMLARPGGFEIPAGETLVLEPGGKHVMLMGPKALEGVQSLPLTLHFERAESLKIEATLMQPGGMDHEGMDHEGMDHGS